VGNVLADHAVRPNGRRSYLIDPKDSTQAAAPPIGWYVGTAAPGRPSSEARPVLGGAALSALR
jgi:hypothetical protein